MIEDFQGYAIDMNESMVEAAYKYPWRKGLFMWKFECIVDHEFMLLLWLAIVVWISNGCRVKSALKDMFYSTVRKMRLHQSLLLDYGSILRCVGNILTRRQLYLDKVMNSGGMLVKIFFW